MASGYGRGRILDLKAQESSAQRSPSLKRSPGTRVRSALRFMRRYGWLRPKRVGCLLVMLVIAAMWLVGRAVDGFNALFAPPVVVGNPLDTVAPTRPTGSGSPTIDRITQRGRLIVAIQDMPGLAQRSSNSGGYTGFDVALVELIARDLGVDPARTSFKPLPPSVRQAALGRGEADLALGGYQITGVQPTDLAAAGPYLVRALQLAVPVTSRATGLNSLGPGQVCASDGSSAAAALVGRGVTVQTRATLADCADLLGGRVEAIAGDQDAVTAVVSQTPGALRVLAEPLGTTEYGVSLPPGDPVLHDRIIAVLRHAIDDGTWARLYAQYLGSPVPIPPVPR
jgi:polar amino acid transport system substrate-binding protein